jgi:WD40 repeat protein
MVLSSRFLHRVWFAVLLTCSLAEPLSTFAQSDSKPPAAPATDSLGDPLPQGAQLRLGTLRFCAPSSVHGLAISADQTSVVSFCKVLIVWNTKTGQERWRAKQEDFGFESVGTGYGIRSLAFSEDSSHFYTPGAGNQFHIWETNTGVRKTIKLTSIKPFPGLDQNFHSIDVSRDGTRVALGNPAGMHVCDLQGRQIFLVGNNPKPAADMHSDDRLTFTGESSLGQFSPDGETLAVVNSDQATEIQLFQADDGRALRTIELKERLVRLDFSPDGTQIAATERDSAIRLYDVKTGTRLWSHTVKLANPFENYTSAVAFRPDGKQIAAGATDRTIYLLDATTGAETGKLKGHRWYPWTLAYTSDSQTLYSSGWDSAIRSWDLKTQLQRPLPFGIRATSVVTASPDGRWIAYADDLQQVRIIDSTDGKEQADIKVLGMEYSRLAYSPDGRWLAAGGNREDLIQVIVWDAETLKQRHSWFWPRGKDPHSTIEEFSFNPQGDQLAAVVFRQDAAFVWDLTSGKQLIRLDHPLVYGLSFSPDSQTLATAGWDSHIRFWNTDSWAERLAFHVPDHADKGRGDLRMYTIQYSPDGSLLATAHLDGTVRIWQADTMQLRGSFELRGRFLFGAIRFSPDGLWLATGSASGEVEIWDPLTCKRVRAAGKHQSYLYTVCFGKDCRSVIGGSSDNLCYQWGLKPTDTTPPADYDKLWDDLASENANEAHRAMWILTDTPDQALPLLAQHLEKVQSVVDPTRLVRDLPQEEQERRKRMTTLLAQKDPQIELTIVIRRAVAVLSGIGSPEARQLLNDLASRNSDSELSRIARRGLNRR